MTSLSLLRSYDRWLPPLTGHNRVVSFVPDGKECIFGVVGDSLWESLLGDGVVNAVAVELDGTMV